MVEKKRREDEVSSSDRNSKICERRKAGVEGRVLWEKIARSQRGGGEQRERQRRR